jgi:hypothetical protein
MPNPWKYVCEHRPCDPASQTTISMIDIAAGNLPEDWRGRLALCEGCRNVFENVEELSPIYLCQHEYASLLPAQIESEFEGRTFPMRYKPATGPQIKWLASQIKNGDRAKLKMCEPCAIEVNRLPGEAGRSKEIVKLLKSPLHPFEAWFCEHTAYWASVHNAGDEVVCEKCLEKLNNGAEIVRKTEEYPALKGYKP